jgi:hypothetical protein
MRFSNSCGIRKRGFGPKLQEPVASVLMVENPPSAALLTREHPEGKKVEKIFVPVHFSDESAKQ